MLSKWTAIFLKYCVVKRKEVGAKLSRNDSSKTD